MFCFFKGFSNLLMAVTFVLAGIAASEEVYAKGKACKTSCAVDLKKLKTPRTMKVLAERKYYPKGFTPKTKVDSIRHSSVSKDQVAWEDVRFRNVCFDKYLMRVSCK